MEFLVDEIKELTEGTAQVHKQHTGLYKPQELEPYYPEGHIAFCIYFATWTMQKYFITGQKKPLLTIFSLLTEIQWQGKGSITDNHKH